MEITPERKDTIQNFCSLVMGRDEAEQFADLDEAIALIKQGQPCWQAPVSIGVHTEILRIAVKTDATDAEDAILKHLISHTIEPLEAQIESLVPKSSGDTLEDERARLLFHSRFGLGFLLRASGDEERAKTVLHEMAATQLSVRGNEIRSGPGVVKQTHDMARGMFLTAILMQIVYEAQEDYGEALYLVTEAIACSFSRPMKTMLFKSASELLDLWATKCNDEDASREYDFISWNWVDLFGEAAEILSLCQDSDASGALPNGCEVDSAQFLAWKFGLIAGRLAIHDRWRENPFEMAHDLLSDRGALDSFPPERGVERVFQALTTVSSLICEYDLGRDWEKARQRYISMWEGSYTYQETPLSELGPESDLYWAMRIGFADTMLEANKQQALIPLQSDGQQISRDITTIKDIVSSIGMRLVKHDQEMRTKSDQLLERLPKKKSEIYHFLEGQLRVVWRELPGEVVNTLIEAEQYYLTEVKDDVSRVAFHKAVEASLNYCLVTPLVNFMKERGDKQIALYILRDRGQEYKNIDQLRKLQLREWGKALEMLHTTTGLDVLKTKDLTEFLKEHLGGQRLPDLRPLSHSLQEVQRYRSGSAHYQKAITRYEKEKWELDQMRNLVLGIGETSAIAQIFKLLAPQELRQEL